jgi:hypothetical protein
VTHHIEPRGPQSLNENRLTGWKAIARFMGRQTRTVQLWERERGLPVHRLPGHPSQSVYADSQELSRWLVSSQRRATVAPKSATARAPGLLVLPFEFRSTDNHVAALVGDTLAQELLHRLTIAPPSRVRVLSWAAARAATARRPDAPMKSLACRVFAILSNAWSKSAVRIGVSMSD